MNLMGRKQRGWTRRDLIAGMSELRVAIAWNTVVDGSTRFTPGPIHAVARMIAIVGIGRVGQERLKCVEIEALGGYRGHSD
jgi:hypothetical protein